MNEEEKPKEREMNVTDILKPEIYFKTYHET